MNDVGLDDDYRASHQELVEMRIFHACSLPEGEGVVNATTRTTVGLQAAHALCETISQK